MISAPSKNGKPGKLANPVERALLGGLMRSPEAVADVRHVVQPSDLYFDWHQKILRAIYRLADRGVVVELAAVAAEVQRDAHLLDDEEGQKLQDLIADLWHQAPTGANALHYADQINNLSCRRSLDQLACGLMVEADTPSGPVVHLLDQTREKLDRLARRSATPAANPLIAGTMDNAAFAKALFPREWVIEDLLVEDEPGVGAGPSKSMKTGIIAVDAAVSVASGKPFLGRFKVPKPRPVFVISAESGAATLQARMKQVCSAKTIEPAGLPIHWYTKVELLSTAEGCRNLEAALRHFGAGFVVLDPSYLLLGGEVTSENAGNMFAMGRLLANVGTAALNAKATPMVLTHSNGRLQMGKVMELSDIAWSGFQQWARQWWLISRREEYQDDGLHRLWLRYGGSAGHTGLLSVDVDEGTLDPDMGGKKWEVTVLNSREARQAKQDEAADEANRKLQADCDQVLAAMAKILATGATVATRNALKDHTGLSRARVAGATDKMVGDGAIVEADGVVKCGHGTKTAYGIRRPDGWA